MKRALILLLVVGGGLAIFVGGPSGILLAVLTAAAVALLLSLRKFFPQTQAASAVGNLVTPSVGVAFAEHASTTGAGEVLLPYETYKKLRKRLLSSASSGLILLLLTLVGLRTLPVPAFILFVPVLLVCMFLLLFSAFSLLKLVPSGQRLRTLKTLFFADPRLVFAQHASHLSNGEVTVGYSTFKRRTRIASYVIGTLAIAAFLVLASQVQQAKNLSQENLDAASTQFKVLADHLLNGQGDLKEQFGKLIAQSLEPAPTVDEDSITSKLLASITKDLPAAPEQIVTNNITEETKVINRDFIEAHTTEAIKLGTGSILSYQDSTGTVFLRLGTGPNVTIPDLATLNVEGFFKLDGTEVTATATELNRTSSLDNTDNGDEGARYVATRAAGFTNFSPSRDDVEAALAAIDTELGTAAGSVSGFTPGSVLFANTDGTITEDNEYLYYDKTNHKLGIGTTTPSSISNASFVVRGLTNSTATAAAVEFLNSSNNTLLYARDDGTVGIGTNSSSDLGGTGQVGRLVVKAANGQSGSSAIKAMNSSTTGSGVIGLAVANSASGSTTQNYSYGLSMSYSSTGSGGANESRNINIATPTVSGGGTLPLSYGLYINTQKTTGVTTGYAIYQTGATDINYFAGNVGIGTTAPAGTLNIVSSSATALLVKNGSNPATLTVDASGGAYPVAIENNAASYFKTTAYRNSTNAGGLEINRARGTAAAPLALNADDRAGTISFLGYNLDGTFKEVAAIHALVNNQVSGTNSGTLKFSVNSGFDEAMRVMGGVTVGGIAKNIVGIGTTAPAYSLDVRDGAGSNNQTASSRVLNVSNAGTRYDTSSGVLSSYGAYVSNTSTRIAGSNALTNIGLYVTSSGAQTNYAAIFDQGNVGIGTTAPTGLLEINGPTNGGLADALTLSTYGNAVAGRGTSMLFNVPLTLTPQASTGGGRIGVAVDASGGTFMSLSTTTVSAGTITERLRVTGSGNVGIGTTAPGFLFDVGGTARTTGSAYFATTSGNVGVGTTAPTSKLNVVASGLAVNGDSGALITSTVSGAASGGLYGLNLATNVTPSAGGSGASVVGLNSAVTLTNTLSTPGGLVAISGSANNLGGVTMTSLKQVMSNGAVYNTSSSVSNYYGFYATNAYMGNGSSQPFGSINRQYGIYIEAQTSGTNNAGILVGEATGTTSTDILIGTTTIPSGNWAIYNTSANNNYFAGNLGIGLTNPSFKLDVTGSARVTGQTTSTDGFVEKIVAGACTDGAFTTATNGLLCLDSSNGRIYFRYGGAWHYAAQTAGFQVPNLLNEHTGLNETAGLQPGDLVMGQLNERLDDGALHGVYVKFDLASEILKLTTVNVKSLIASGTIVVHGDATFLGDVDVQGILAVSKQQAGFAQIPDGGKEVRVTFETAFAVTPVIYSTPHAAGETAWVGEESETGFTLHLSHNATKDMLFSWLALPVKNPVVSKGQVAGDIDPPAGGPTPTPTPTPTPDSNDEEDSEEPAPSATPTASPTPSVSPTVTPSPSPSPTPTESPSPTP